MIARGPGGGGGGSREGSVREAVLCHVLYLDCILATLQVVEFYCRFARCYPAGNWGRSPRDASALFLTTACESITTSP